MRALFFGSPAFAVPCLDALAGIAEVACVYSQPDRPAGRGMKLRAPAVKVRALELGFEVRQPTKVRTRTFAEEVAAHEVDVALVVAYGRILPKRVLEGPRLGCVNVHASILPRWRGAAPIQWAVVSGDAETGVTLMQMDEGMDTGPILRIERTTIAAQETSGELAQRLSALGAEMVRRDLPRYVAGELGPTPQPVEGATHARMLEKADGELDFSQPAQAVHDRARGMRPWPGAFTHHEGARLKVHETRVLEVAGEHGAPGTVLDASDGIRVCCAPGIVALDVVQEAGRKRLPAATFVGGRGVPAKLGEQDG